MEVHGMRVYVFVTLYKIGQDFYLVICNIIDTMGLEALSGLNINCTFQISTPCSFCRFIFQ